jgi:hypothetical protein
MRSRHVFKTSKYTERNGTVYLLHFCPPYKHAGHYVGFVKGGARAVRQRLDRHLAGQGARLIEVATLAGCAIRLARIWRQSGVSATLLLDWTWPGRRIGQCWEATRAPTQGPRWAGAGFGSAPAVCSPNQHRHEDGPLHLRTQDHPRGDPSVDLATGPRPQLPPSMLSPRCPPSCHGLDR